jgi:hypothetical protein
MLGGGALSFDAAAAITSQVRNLLYVSRSTLAPDDREAQVADIVAGAQVRNEPLQITGALVFTGERFAQYLEGPPAAIEELMTSIRRDTRHLEILELPIAPFSSRLFESWSLAYSGSTPFVARLVHELAAARHPTAPACDKLVRLIQEFTGD